MADLLDEIEQDHDFYKQQQQDSKFVLLSKRIELVELQIEALTLILKAKNIFNEELFQIAIGHVVDSMKAIAKDKMVVDEALITKIQTEFEEKARFLELLPPLEQNP